MKQKTLLIFALLFVLLPQGKAFAQTFEYTYEGQTLKYAVLDEYERTCKIAKHYNISGDLIIPEKVRTEGKNYKVTSIGEQAFYNCRNLTGVTIPNSITSIGLQAFSGCTAMCNLVIPNSIEDIGNRAFEDCLSLTSLEIPNSVTSIGYKAFEGCSGIKEIKIEDNNDYKPLKIADEAFNNVKPEILYLGRNISYSDYNSPFKNNRFLHELIIGNKVDSIEKSAFSGCAGLTSLTIGYSVTTIGNSAFLGCSSLTSLIIPDWVTTIGNSAFSGCSSLTSLIIPDSVTTIGNSAFSGCSSLTSLIIPDSVTTIGNSAFFGCSSLTSLIIPDSVTTIGDSAFSRCSSLTEVILGKSLNIIALNAFKACDKLIKCACPNTIRNLFDISESNVYGYDPKDAVIENGIIYNKRKTEIGYATINLEGEFIVPKGITVIGSAAFSKCRSLTSVVIPNSVTTIGESAFLLCDNLTSVVIPNSVTTIGDSTFSGCGSLPSVFIPNSVTTIGESAFSGCGSLTSVVIPNSVTTIGDSAFYYCKSMAEVILGKSLTKIGTDAFKACYKLIKCACPNTIGNPSGISYSKIYKYNPNDAVIENGIIYNKDKTKIIYATINLEGEYIIPNSVSEIGGRAFMDCDSLTSVIIPNSVTRIGWSAFEDCDRLTSVVIPNSVTRIGYNAFAGCMAIKELNIKDGEEILLIEGEDKPLVRWKPEILYLGRNISYEESIMGEHPLFMDNTNLQNLIIGNCVTSLNPKEFYGCSNLKEVIFGSSLTNIGNEVFQGCDNVIKYAQPNTINYHSLGNVDTARVVYNPEDAVIENGIIYNKDKTGIFYATINLEGEFIIPNSVSVIGNSAFYECGSLTSVVIPNSVTSIFSEAFYKCWGLTSIEIPNSVTSISSEAFFWCRSLTSVTIGKAVTYIGFNAFVYCPIFQINCLAPIPPSMQSNPFSTTATDEAELHVVKGTADLYKNAQYWNEFYHIIDDLEEDENVSTGIEDIPVDVKDFIEEGPDASIINSYLQIEIYDLNGFKVGNATDGLVPGIYIVRKGSKTSKITVK